MNEITKILMDRDGDTADEAEDRLDEARQRLADGDDPAEILQEEFGLEPDYLFHLMP